MAASANKVLFGLSNVHVAFLDEATGVYDTPVAIPGIVKLSLKPEGKVSEFYADNVKYFAADSNNGYTGDIETAMFPDDVLVDALGWEIDTTGALVEVADGMQKPLALLFEVEGNVAQKRYAYFNVKVARPGEDHGTQAGTIEPGTQTAAVTIMPIDIDGKLIVKSSLELTVANKTVYDAWYTAVTKPTFPAV